MTTRIATPFSLPTAAAAYQVGQAMSVLLAEIIRRTDIDDDGRWALIRAAHRASEHILASVWWRRDETGAYLFRSESTPEITHRCVARIGCDCRAAVAGRACWHVPAARLLTILHTPSTPSPAMAQRTEKLRWDQAEDAYYDRRAEMYDWAA